MKKCLVCGTLISNEAGDLCENCKKKKEDFIWEEKFLNTVADIVLWIGIAILIFIPFIMVGLQEDFFTIILGICNYLVIIASSIFSSILLKLLVKVSYNIRKIANSKDNSNE